MLIELYGENFGCFRDEFVLRRGLAVFWAEFRERQNVNLRRRYLQGRYGAIPAVGSFAQ
jgi:hypothetical protein